MILLIPFMIYIYYTNHSLSSAMQNNDALRSKIEALDEFKVSIIDMAVMSKYYLITGDEEYNIEFENSYDTASDKIESLYESQYISQSEKDDLSLFLIYDFQKLIYSIVILKSQLLGLFVNFIFSCFLY